MAYKGYLLKIGDYIVPTDKFVKADSYSPYVNMQDIDDWTDGDGYLHRNTVALKVAKVEFETPYGLTNVTLEEFMSNIRRNYTNTDGREAMVEVYIPEYDDYVLQKCYIADIKPQIYALWGDVIKYDPIKFSIIGGLADE